MGQTRHNHLTMLFAIVLCVVYAACCCYFCYFCESLISCFKLCTCDDDCSAVPCVSPCLYVPSVRKLLISCIAEINDIFADNYMVAKSGLFDFYTYTVPNMCCMYFYVIYDSHD